MCTVVLARLPSPCRPRRRPWLRENRLQLRRCRVTCSSVPTSCSVPPAGRGGADQGSLPSDTAFVSGDVTACRRGVCRQLSGSNARTEPPARPPRGFFVVCWVCRACVLAVGGEGGGWGRPLLSGVLKARRPSGSEAGSSLL